MKFSFANFFSFYFLAMLRHFHAPLQAWKLYEKGMHTEFVDKTLDPNEYDAEEVKKIIEIGLLCTQTSPASRPTMFEVVDMIESKGELADQKRPTMPVYVDSNFMPTRYV